MREYQKDKEVKKSELNEDFPATPMQTVKYVFALSVTVVLWSAGVYGLYNLMEFDRMLANTMEKACIRMNFYNPEKYQEDSAKAISDAIAKENAEKTQ